MDFDKLYPARFMKAGEFEGRDVTLTISDVKVEELESVKGKKGKGIISFEKTPKELVLNRTNGECIKAMFGRDTANWIGKRVTLFPASITDSFTGDPILAIRVRGSPDIDADKAFSATIGREKRNFSLKKTAGPKPKPVPAQAPSASIPDAAEQAAITANESTGSAA